MSVAIKEKRKHERKRVNIPASIKKLSGQGPAVGESSVTRDLSEGGASFVVSGFIPLSQRVVVELGLGSSSKPVKLIAKMAWVKRREAGKGNEMGFQFLDSSREDKKLLGDYIDTVK